MKKLSLIFTVLFAVFMAVSVKAQTTTADYFAGRWDVLIIGTPNGDAKLSFIFNKLDGKLLGSIQDTTGKEVSKITQIDQKDKSITAAFNIQSYDVTLTLDPVDENHVKGSLMGMFEAKGIRIKEGK